MQTLSAKPEQENLGELKQELDVDFHKVFFIFDHIFFCSFFSIFTRFFFFDRITRGAFSTNILINITLFYCMWPGVNCRTMPAVRHQLGDWTNINSGLASIKYKEKEISTQLKP